MASFSLRETLSPLTFESVLEIGCGTGKNTEWLAGKSKKILGVDFSEGMLSVARLKKFPTSVEFIQADINQDWNFISEKVDLVVFSLVLEHIRDLDGIFKRTDHVLNDNGFVYIGELHPFKQYTGSQAKFDTEEGTQLVNGYIHHVSEFITAATRHGFELSAVREYFDTSEKDIPRILTLLLRKC